ncbi:MAG: hypothetical protein LBQ02_04310 [Candidatus Nomurabacteria bacterium]|jgi:hypothetical protein|nr:hypothetical protein [Candidatus Nomurabacteria bacterium]
MNKLVKGLSVSALVVACVAVVATPALAISDPTIIMGVRNAGATGDFTKNITATPGEQVDVDVAMYNTTGVDLVGVNDQMDYRVNLDTKNVLSIVPNSATLTTKKGTSALTNANDILSQHSLGQMSKYVPDSNGDGVDEQGWAVLRFKVQVPSVDKLLCGLNSYHFSAQITAYQDGKIASDTQKFDVSITVTGKNCGGNNDNKNDDGGKTDDNKGDNKTTAQSKMPPSGPADVIAPVVGAGTLATASAYYIISRKKA